MNKIKKQNGTNKYDLLGTLSPDIFDIYNNVFSTVEGSLTTVIDNDAESKYNIAINSLKPTCEQLEALDKFKTAFKKIEKLIDPEKLNFNIAAAFDNEICINRVSDFGISKIIIHDDGLIARSFISYKGVHNKKDILDFYEDDVDYESITLKFFS
jgi:hypothetical protein